MLRLTDTKKGFLSLSKKTKQKPKVKPKRNQTKTKQKPKRNQTETKDKKPIKKACYFEVLKQTETIQHQTKNISKKTRYFLQKTSKNGLKMMFFAKTYKVFKVLIFN